MSAPFSNDPPVRRRVQIDCSLGQPSRTKQSMKNECDINYLMEKFQKTGQMPATNPFPGTYGDFSNVDDYQGSLNQVLEANASFGELPANIRARFNNDPAQLLAFMADENNADEAIELGLIPARIVPTPAIPNEDSTSPPGTGEGETATD